MCNISYSWPDTLRKFLSMSQFLSPRNLLYRQMTLLYHSGNFYLALLTIVIFCWSIYCSTTVEINTVNIVSSSENQFKINTAESFKLLWVPFLNYVDWCANFFRTIICIFVSTRLLPFLQTLFVSFTVPGSCALLGLMGSRIVRDNEL